MGAPNGNTRKDMPLRLSNEMTPARGVLIAVLAIVLVFVTVLLWMGGGYLTSQWLGASGGGKLGAGLGLLIALGFWVQFLRWCGFQVSLRKVLRWDENWKDDAK